LVQFPRFWGFGAHLTRHMLDRGFTELGLSDVLVALPYSRTETAQDPQVLVRA
jgi:hypothetical protein